MRLEDEILRSTASSQAFFVETLDVIVCLHKTSCEQLCNSVSSKKPQYVIVKQIGSQSKLTLIRQNKCSFYKRRSVFRISFSNFKQIELFYYLSFHCSWCSPFQPKLGNLHSCYTICGQVLRATLSRYGSDSIRAYLQTVNTICQLLNINCW